MGGWRAAARIARRELRGGLRSFRVFLACLALGVAGLAAVGSVVAAIEAGLRERSQFLLGGDVAVELTYRFAEPEERAALAALGAVSEVVELRGMARRPADAAAGVEADAAVAQIKAVDGAYPLYGEATLEPPIALQDALRAVDGRFGAVVEPALAARLGLRVGDALRIGSAEFELRALITAEPDKLPSGVAFGPRAMIATAAIEPAGLAQPGLLFETQYRVRTSPGTDIAAERARLPERFPEGGWRWRDAETGAPGVETVVARIGAFLTLVGLAALAVGGVGVGASVRAYLDQKTETIATLKTLGAEGRTILRAYLLQIVVLAALGVGVGLALGAATPILLAPLLAASLPVPANFGVYAAPLGEAAAYGMLAAVLFALWPLARAREIRAAGLFRDLVAPAATLPPWRDLAVIALAALTLSGAIIAFTGQQRLAIGFLAGVAGALLALALAAEAVAWAAAAAARAGLGRRRLALRLALRAVAGSGRGAPAETRGALLALGLGLTVLTAIGLIDANLRRGVADELPKRAPAYFVIDIQNAEIERFRANAEAAPGVRAVETAPMLRGVVTGVNGMSAQAWRESGRVSEDFEWVLRGDRGVTYAAAAPDGTELTEGAWWPADYAGAPLVSFGAEQGAGLGLAIGDRIAVSVLGRTIEAEIANFRRVEFSDGGINFLMIFNEGVLKGAPHAFIATVYGEEPSPGAYLKRFAEAFPAATAIRVSDVIARIERVLGEVAAAARAGATATLATGLVVLIGASAAGQRRQIYQAAVLKTLGATRRTVLAALAWRAALLGFAASIVAFAAGAAGAWAVTAYAFDAPFTLDLDVAATILLGGVGATMLAGALFALGPLSARPARVLRARD